MSFNSLICKFCRVDNGRDITVEIFTKGLYSIIITVALALFTILSLYTLLCIYINGLFLASEFDEDMLNHPLDIMSMMISIVVTVLIIGIILLIIWGAIKDKKIASCPIKEE